MAEHPVKTVLTNEPAGGRSSDWCDLCERAVDKTDGFTVHIDAMILDQDVYMGADVCAVCSTAALARVKQDVMRTLHIPAPSTMMIEETPSTSLKRALTDEPEDAPPPAKKARTTKCTTLFITADEDGNLRATLFDPKSTPRVGEIMLMVEEAREKDLNPEETYPFRVCELLEAFRIIINHDGDDEAINEAWKHIRIPISIADLGYWEFAQDRMLARKTMDDLPQYAAFFRAVLGTPFDCVIPYKSYC